jgi:superfamily I DNA and/or RNA helicase
MHTESKTEKTDNIVFDKKIKNLKYYQNKAIDFSRRNRLLKFPNRATSIEFDVPFEDCPQFFGSINELKMELPHKEILKQDEVQEEILENKNVEEEIVLPKINYSGKKLITQLDKLRLQAKNNFDSHGLHTLFLSVGELKWKDELAGHGSAEAIPDHDYSAPFLLIPVNIVNQKLPHKKSVIELNDELYDIQINPVLNLFLKQQFDLKIPERLDKSIEFSWDDIKLLLKKYQNLIKDDKGIPCSITNKIRLGQFTFHGQQIYEDLTRNEESLIEHEFISSLCGEGQIIQSSDNIEDDEKEESVDNFLTNDEDFTILDADESQLRAIKSVIDGKHMVIHGPPGTGKSQTIANLISNLLARGKKVLFVCEKQVALDVVYNRLKTKGADISDLCLPLFQYAVDKKLFAKSIIDSRNRITRAIESVSTNSINKKLAEREDRIDILRKYSNALLTETKPLNKNVHWLHTEFAKIEMKVDCLIFPWRIKNYNDIDFSIYQKIVSILGELNSYNNEVFDTNNHWGSLRQQCFSPDYSARLFAKLNDLKNLASQFPEINDSIIGKPKNIKEVESMLSAVNEFDVKDFLQNRLIRTNKFRLKELSEEQDKLCEIKKILAEYSAVSIEPNKFKGTQNWKVIDIKAELIDKDTEIDKLFLNKQIFSEAKNKTTILKNILSKNKHCSLLGNFNIVALKKYQDLFNADPIIQKIKGWDERVNLYDAQNALKQIKAVYDRLIEAQEVLNEWVISLDNVDKKSLWLIEERFTKKYKNFLRIFYPSYKKDNLEIANWCSTHRPCNFNEFRKIVFAVADKIRLEDKFDKIAKDFIENYTIEKSFRNLPISALVDSVDKILKYLEYEKIDKLSEDIKNLFTLADQLDSIKQIISISRELSVLKDTLNSATEEKFLDDNIPISSFLNFTGKICKEVENFIYINDQLNEHLYTPTKNKKIGILIEDIRIINSLRIICDRLISENFGKFTNFITIQDLINDKIVVDRQSQQIRFALRIVGERNFSRNEFYKSIGWLYSGITNWEKWSTEYKILRNEMQELMDNQSALSMLELVEFNTFNKYINEMLSDKDGLERWMNYQRIKGQLEGYEMFWFIDDLKKYNITKYDFSDVFIWSFLNRVLLDVYQNSPILKSFNIADYSRYISEFKKLESEIFEVNQYRVLNKIYPNIKYAKNHGGQSERLILRESQKMKRHLPIRKLVTDNAAHILECKPCWLMSPLTLSSYIPFGSVNFDVVIFDESSQMRIENALGSIARAKQVIVIGDEHQLPPTSFFNVLSDDSEEEEESMEEVGYESILQAAITILPGAESYLTYHYRSRHPDLIAFSNDKIYKNLIIFPAPKDYGAVQFDFVENGIYDAGQSRRNHIEAQRVVELCIKHFESSTTSLGVIAFSKAQEEAIRDAVSEKLKDYPHLAEKFDETVDVRNKNNEDSSFFIRNLESVQGDERDTIILSVGYGPDKNGNVYNRFGPINSKGGYRRLNVAITRSRDKIICVSSMKFFQISPSEGAFGVILLQKYLEYAEKGRCVLDASKTVTNNYIDADSDFEVSVQNALSSIGYQIHRQVGASGFSIDLAVVNPKNEKEYILGIECDGAAYHSAKSIRIRDRLRQEILERLGWNIYRVWSQHWIYHRQEIVNDIVKYINKLQ